MQKKILFVTAQLPYPINDGWKIRTFNLIKGLSESGYAIDLLTFIKEDTERDFSSNLKLYCDNIFFVLRNKEYTLIDLIKGIVSKVPFTILNYYHAEMQKTFIELVQKNKYDYLQIEDIVMSQYLPQEPASYTILDMHNIESALMRRYAQYQSNIFKKYYATFTVGKVARYETLMTKYFECILVCSADDKKILEKQNIFRKIEIIPNGIDCAFYEYQAEKQPAPSLVFVGRMDYHANITGITYFIKKVFPLILERYPELKLYVVGKNPVNEIKRLAAKNIIISGEVDDVRPYLASAQIVIVPLLVGGGTRLKILEAMAMGKAVVSTSLGCEGISAKDGDTIFIADTKEQFVEKIGLLLDNESLRKNIGINAQKFVRMTYDWAVITETIRNVYAKLIP
jgi:sugar transferase (PEP-CTERM/EpsH1 system associated)